MMKNTKLLIIILKEIMSIMADFLIKQSDNNH